MAKDQFPDDGGLLKDIPSLLTADCEQSSQRLIFPAAPSLGQDRIPFA